MFVQTIFQAGNSKVVSIPASIINDLNLKVGEKVTVDKLDDMTVVIKKTSPSKKAKASTHFASWLKSFMNENGEILDELAER